MEMQEYQKQAWDCLTPEEQNSLFLSTSQGMSTWGVGEVLKLSHYKYLELKARAEKFFKMFADYYQLHPSLINPNCPISPMFRDYLFATMVKRLPKEEALSYAGDSAFRVSEINSQIITKNMMRLRKSEDKWDQDLRALIYEFDRWNNYRILPRALQAPSAYKRRSRKKDKTYIKYLHQIPDFKIKALVDIYWCGSKGKESDRYYMPLVSDFFEDNYAVVPVKKTPEIIRQISDNKLYLFQTRDEADEFGIIVSMFFEETINQSRGLKFWKKYQNIVESAINYREINNMDFTAENLDSAFGLKRIPVNRKKKPKK